MQQKDDGWQADDKAKQCRTTSPARSPLRKVNFSMLDTLVPTSKQSQVRHIASRCSQVTYMSVQAALRTLVVSKSGDPTRYTITDLKYDLGRGFLSVRRRTASDFGGRRIENAAHQLLSNMRRQDGAVDRRRCSLSQTTSGLGTVSCLEGTGGEERLYCYTRRCRAVPVLNVL